MIKRLLFQALGAVALLSLPLADLAKAAPYAAMVMDARTGKVLHSRNADTRLHPASLTKMMTLYVAFEAIERGEISASKKVKISRNAAAEPPSKLGLRAGSRIELRYLLRAAAVKSANDAATAIGEAISGSEAAFTRRMTQTARAMGMKRTTFKNAHGLTAGGHLSTARDMSILGRHMIYDYPEYYHLFSRRKVDAGLRTVSNTNIRLLDNYKGADGIKTGYTRAAGYNLVASAERGRERVIATVFGGKSTATRNARVAELLNMGFGRAPTWARVRKPARPKYIAPSKREPARVRVASNAPAPKGIEQARANGGAPKPAAKTGRVIRTVTAVKRTIRPQARPVAAEVLVAQVDTNNINKAILEANTVTDIQATSASLPRSIKPVARPNDLIRVVAAPAPEEKVARAIVQPVITPKVRPAAATQQTAKVQPTATRLEIVPKQTSNAGNSWAITLGKYDSRYSAERVLVRMALAETGTLYGAQRRVKQRSNGYEALFTGLSRDNADLACRRLKAQNHTCLTISPS